MQQAELNLQKHFLSSTWKVIEKQFMNLEKYSPVMEADFFFILSTIEPLGEYKW